MSRRQLWREMTGKCEPFAGNAATDYGVENEQNAISDYEVKTGRLVMPTGFWAHPSHDWLGASPDGLTLDDGCLEVKCKVDGRTYSSVPDHYMAQVQGCLECTGRSWCDFVSWAPGEIGIIWVDRDPDYWNWMFPLLEEFWEYVKSDKEPKILRRRPEYKGKGNAQETIIGCGP